MINIPAGARVLLATRPVDFRKGAHSLAALAQDGANRNLPILEARPFRGVGGQFLDRHVERNIGQHQHVQRVVGGSPEAAAAPMICCSSSTVIRRRNASAMLSG